MQLNSNKTKLWLEDLEAEWQVPGLAVAVVQAGRVSYLQGFGLANVEEEVAVTPDTRFAIGSTTKAFTTMAMAMLVDEGILDWDTPVRQYMPSFYLWDSFASEHVTPRDLVTHRTGLPRHDHLWRFTSCSRSELVQRLQYLEPTYDLRTAYQYNNLMYMAAGYLVEHLTGITWEDFVQSRILEPLGMSNSGPGRVDSINFSDYALPYAEIDGGIKRVPFFSNTTIGPAGSISSTASDMARWLLLHLNAGQYEGQTLVSKENLTQMHSPQMLVRGIGPLTGSEQIEEFDEIGFGSYGLGWRINTYRGHTMVHHAGGIDGYSSFVALMPQNGSGVVVLSNLNGTPIPYILSFGIYDRLLDLEPLPWNQRIKAFQSGEDQSSQDARTSREANRKSDANPSHPLEDYAGEYAHPAYGTIKILVKEGRLVADYGGYTLPLTHYHYDIFYLAADLEDEFVPVSFGGDVQGKISQLSIPLEPAVSEIIFIRQGK
jgi:CubicO group peptidase (beta-lactamase class C family)